MPAYQWAFRFVDDVFVLESNTESVETSVDVLDLELGVCSKTIGQYGSADYFRQSSTVAVIESHDGGPGRAGGGSELGGLRGLELYLQRVAVTGDRALIEKVSGQPND